MIYFVSHRRIRFLGCCQAKDCITRCINCTVLGANLVLTGVCLGGEFLGVKKDVDCVRRWLPRQELLALLVKC